MKSSISILVLILAFNSVEMLSKGGPAIKTLQTEEVPNNNNDGSSYATHLRHNVMVLDKDHDKEIRNDLIEIEFLSKSNREFKTESSHYTIALESGENEGAFNILDGGKKILNAYHKISNIEGRTVGFGDDKLGITLAVMMGNEIDSPNFYLWEHSDWNSVYVFEQQDFKSFKRMYTSQKGGLFIENDKGVFEIVDYELDNENTKLVLKEIRLPEIHK